MKCAICGRGFPEVRVDTYGAPGSTTIVCDPCLRAECEAEAPPSAPGYAGGWEDEALGEFRMLNGPEGSYL